MIIKGVEFPEQLILDQRAGRLVIFAGAGVSLPPPSSLPNFVELTEEVVSRKLKKHEKTQLDRILGAAHHAGTNVHKATRLIIDRAGSRPTPLHKSLLGLSLESSMVRVVTTNFDRHFSTAAKDLFPDRLEEFYAPALPLGHDFTGIVYLHGSLERDEGRFVLTDSDFGRAYLTEGWATRFLWELFRKYTVLFVGYSHNDPVMHYLSKGLPSDMIGNRYALVPDGDASRWNALYITPIPYPVHRRSRKALAVAVAAWANLSAMGALDYEHRIKSIVEGSTYLSEEDASFILYAIRHTSYVKFFAKHAARLDWLLWVEANDLLKPLFKPDKLKEDFQGVLAGWIVDMYLISETNALLSLIQRQGQYLNPALWNSIAWKLQTTNPRPESTIVARMIPILLKSSHPLNHIEHLDHILLQCKAPELAPVAILLFEYLTTPYIKLQRSFAMEGDERTTPPTIEIETPGNDYWLREAWKRVFTPNIVMYARELEIITSSQLLQADLLLKSYRGPEAFDSVSYGRSAIEPHPQDRHPGKHDVIIDAARDSIEYLMKNEPNTTTCLINRWYSAGPEIMKRIAMHTLAESTTISADYKIQWLLDRELLYSIGCVHEVFRVLKVAYSKASEKIRSKLLKIVKQGIKGKNAKKLKKKNKAYEIFNLFYWITLADPSCQLASQAFLEMKQANPEFPLREHPDFHHWSGGAKFVGHVSPVTIEDLMAKEPADQLDFLLTFNPPHPFDEPDRDGLLNAITQAVQQNFEWGYKLAQTLIGAQAWESDIWGHILRGWEDGLEDDSNLIEVLNLLINNHKLFSHDYYISNLIQKRFNEKKEATGTAIDLAMQIAEQLMEHLDAAPEQEQEESNDWLQMAINHSGGKLAEFWIHILSRARESVGDSWSGLPDIPRRCLDKMITGTSIDAQLARVFIASQLYFMFYMDASWTISRVLPLLEWSDPLRARQCWDGYLFWGRYGENTLPHVMPLYRRTFRELHTLRDEQRRRFCEHMASIAIYSSINPLEDGWLTDFIASVEEKDRAEWAQQFGHIIRDLDDDAAKLMWDEWLGKYWHRRNLGQIAPLSQSELAEMIEWSACLGGVFDKVVKLICELPAPEITESYMFHLMNEKEFAKRHTQEIAKLLIHLIPKITKPWFCNELVPLAKGLRDAGLDALSFAKIQDALVTLGCNETI